MNYCDLPRYPNEGFIIQEPTPTGYRVVGETFNLNLACLLASRGYNVIRTGQHLRSLNQ